MELLRLLRLLLLLLCLLIGALLDSAAHASRLLLDLLVLLLLFFQSHRRRCLGHLERAQVQRLQALHVLNDALLGQLFLLRVAHSQYLLQALYLHESILHGWVVGVRLEHLQDDLKLSVLLDFVDLLLSSRSVLLL